MCRLDPMLCAVLCCAPLKPTYRCPHSAQGLEGGCHCQDPGGQGPQGHLQDVSVLTGLTD
jgi:hypothetical protein